MLPYVAVAVHITAVDSLSGANATPGSTMVIRDGAYSDSVVAPELAPAMGLGVERTGTFDVTVRKPGYRTWTKTGVRVDGGECNVKTVSLLARLQPSP